MFGFHVRKSQVICVELRNHSIHKLSDGFSNNWSSAHLAEMPTDKHCTFIIQNFKKNYKCNNSNAPVSRCWIME